MCIRDRSYFPSCCYLSGWTTFWKKTGHRRFYFYYRWKYWTSRWPISNYSVFRKAWFRHYLVDYLSCPWLTSICFWWIIAKKRSRRTNSVFFNKVASMARNKATVVPVDITLFNVNVKNGNSYWICYLPFSFTEQTRIFTY